MQYYWLIQSTGDDIGKASSQVKGMIEGYDYYAENSVWKLPLFEKPNFEPNFNALQLNNSAKLTDIIIPTGLISKTGFFLSEKVKNLLKEFKLPTHIYYQTVIIHKNKAQNNFYWIQFTQEMSDTIDYENSIFDLKEAFGWQNWIEIESNIKFKSTFELIEFEKIQSSMKQIIPSKLSIINNEFDIYGFKYFPNKILITEKLKNAFDTNDIKGVEMLLFENN